MPNNPEPENNGNAPQDSTEILIQHTLKTLKQLLKSGKFKEAESYGKEKIKELPVEIKGDSDENMSEIYFVIGSAVWEQYKDKDKARPYALKAIHFNRQNKYALWLYRETGADYSDDSVYFQADVAGRYTMLSKGKKKVFIFKTVYGVVASSPEETLELIREIERPDIRDSLELIKATEIEKKSELPKGVYSTTGLVGLGGLN